MGHAATKPDKVNISVTKDFRDQNLVMWLLKSSIWDLFQQKWPSRSFLSNLGFLHNINLQDKDYNWWKY